MCLLIVLSRVLPRTPLVVAGNRDERFDRPATPMAVLRDVPRTLGGRDLVGGGTWLAASASGVVAGLTNRPLVDGPSLDKRSRGALPLALTSRPSAAAAVEAFVDHHRPEDYNPAWLLVGDRQALFVIDMTGSTRAAISEQPPGVYVLENRALGEASVKVEHVRARLAGVEAMTLDQATERLAAVLADHQVPTALTDDDSNDEHAAFRAPCVHTPEFGTRWSGIVTVPADPAASPTFRYTEGPPCRSPLLDAALWD